MDLETHFSAVPEEASLGVSDIPDVQHVRADANDVARDLGPDQDRAGTGHQGDKLHFFTDTKEAGDRTAVGRFEIPEHIPILSKPVRWLSSWCARGAMVLWLCADHLLQG